MVLLAAVGVVLLIACANLGNLLLGRTAARRKELAIRTALGALRGRLIRQIVTEAFVLAAAGADGLLLAYWATGFFIAIGGDSIPRPEAIAIDARALGSRSRSRGARCWRPWCRHCRHRGPNRGHPARRWPRGAASPAGPPPPLPPLPIALPLGPRRRPGGDHQRNAGEAGLALEQASSRPPHARRRRQLPRRWLTVVGIVPDSRADVRRQIWPEVYLTTLQLTPRGQMLLVRTTGIPPQSCRRSGARRGRSIRGCRCSPPARSTGR